MYFIICPEYFLGYLINITVILFLYTNQYKNYQENITIISVISVSNFNNIPYTIFV